MHGNDTHQLQTALPGAETCPECSEVNVEVVFAYPAGASKKFLQRFRALREGWDTLVTLKICLTCGWKILTWGHPHPPKKSDSLEEDEPLVLLAPYSRKSWITQ